MKKAPLLADILENYCTDTSTCFDAPRVTLEKRTRDEQSDVFEEPEVAEADSLDIDSSPSPCAPKAKKQQTLHGFLLRTESKKDTGSSLNEYRELTRSQQLDSGCGNNPRLVKYARDKYGDKRGGMPTSAVISWYRKHPDQLPEHLQGRDFGTGPDDLQVCHIISKAKGGHDWVYNYGIYTKKVNDRYGKYLPKEWSRYIGLQVECMAESFARYTAKKAAAVLTFGAFDPVSDIFLAKGR